jgi:4-hydroxy-tetrahydrodipicolinate synthase
MSSRFKGVLTPVITPFTAALQPDSGRFVRHCEWMMSNDVGLAIFGTNSEANSLSVEEKQGLLDALLEAGIDTGRLMPGTGACAIPDNVRLTRYAVRAGCGGVLMLPPFYYKNVDDEGLFRFFSTVIDQVADDALRVYLYHIPPVSQVPLSLALIERLLKAYPGIIAGIKDSSGDWNNTSALIREFAPAGFEVFAGTEALLLPTMRAGGAGCISATANVNPARIVQLFRTWQQADADQQQAGLNALRDLFQQFPMIPALKAAVAHFSGDAAWATVRPPLSPLNESQTQSLISRLQAVDFSMPGLPKLASA